MLRLIIVDEGGHSVEVPLVRDEITIGRKEGNTIRLIERNISRHHAMLTREGDKVYIEDMDSYNGVFLNANRISRKTALYAGDLIEIGDYKIGLEKIQDEESEKVTLDPEALATTQREMAERDGEIASPGTGESEVPAGPSDQPAGGEADLHSSQTLIIPAFGKPPEAKDAPKPSAETPVAKPMKPDEAAEKDHSAATGEARDAAKPVFSTAQTLIIPAMGEPEHGPLDGEKTETPKKQPLPEAQAEAEEKPAEDEPKAESEPVEPKPAAGAESESAQVGEEPPKDEFAWLDEPTPQSSAVKWIVIGSSVLLVSAFLGYLFFAPEDEVEFDMPPLVAPDGALSEEVVPEIEAARDRDRKAREAVQESMAHRRQELEEEARRAEEREEGIRNRLIDTALAEAREQMSRQQWHDAERTLNLLLEDIPDHREAISLRDRSRLEKENRKVYQEGLKALSKRRYIQAVSKLIQVDTDSYYHRDARENYTTARRKLVKEYTARGWREYRMEHYRQGLILAKKALDLDENHGAAERLKKACKRKLRSQPPEAEEQPRLDARGNYRVAAGYYKQRQYQKAIEHFNKALEINRNYAYAYRGLGVCYASINQMDKALAAYQRYVDLKPNADDAEQVRQIIRQYQSNRR